MASEKTVMAQTRSIILDRLKWLEQQGAATYPRFTNEISIRDWHVMRHEYEFYTNFLLLEAKHGTKYTEVALSEAFGDCSAGGTGATKVRGN